MSIPSRILITGFSGFVGSYLVELCRVHYPDAALFGLCKKSRSPVTTASTIRGVTPLVADITQPGLVRKAVAQAQPDLVFHLAAQPSVAASWSDPEQVLKVNAGGALHLFEALRSERLSPRIILVGSGEQYGMVQLEENPLREECLFRPVSPYAVSKAAQDLYGYQYFATYGLPILRVRSFNHFGPRQPATFVVASFARQIALIEAGKAEPVLFVGNLTAQRDFLPVEDVVGAYVALADQGQPGEAYNVGSGRARSIGEMLNLLLSLAKPPISVCEDPSRFRPVDVPLLVADTTRLHTHTGWKPAVDFEWALRQILDYWREAVVSTSSA
jgi:GDP-4-dehydro-6-deoxy-D-mannose reductase